MTTTNNTNTCTTTIANPRPMPLTAFIKSYPNPRLLPAFDARTESVPALDPGHVLPAWSKFFLLYLSYTDGGYVNRFFWLTGPTGSGKTSTVKNIAARLNVPCYEVTGHSRLETPELIGHYALNNGNTEWIDGPLVSAMRTGGWFIFNEIDLIDPSTAAGLNTILDGSALCIPETNEVIHPHPLFRMIATANTVGGDDETGLYQGTLRANAAFMDRFVVLECDYLDAKTETKVLTKKFPDLPAETISTLVRFANLVRSFKDDKNLPTDDVNLLSTTSIGDVKDSIIPLSTRSLTRWAEMIQTVTPMCKRKSPIDMTLDAAFGRRADATTRAALHEVLQRLVDQQA